MVEIKIPDQVTIKAYAKVNLGLDIVGTREDGYHLVRMIMQSLDLADIITIKKTDKAGVIDVQDGLNLGKDNLIYKAADKVLAGTGVLDKYGVEIMMEKHIPVAAGMAGGSSDAAATLKGLNELFDLKLHDKELMEIGVKLGADVPYCIMLGTALSEGIGEVLTRLPDIPRVTFLIAKPPVSVSTQEAYRDFDSLKVVKHPDIDAQTDAIYKGDIREITALCGNVLETVTAGKYPEIGQLEEIMEANGAIKAMMSGSGPTVFGVFEDVETAEAAKKKVDESGLALETYVVGAI
jgi:4-diphosphocytidyl-2-C-methyl-D-erythritol kinase